MKKNILIIIIFLAIMAAGFYFYIYKGHRNIASEDAAYSVSVSDLQKEFGQNDSLSNIKYLDKTIEVKGKITGIDAENHSVLIDEKLSAVFKDSILPQIILQQQIKIKGRFIGYDDLLEEFKIDQASVNK